MCQVVSWIEKSGRVKFLTGETITSDKFLTWAKKHGVSPDDYVGHGTLRAWYKMGQDEGIDHECNDFSTPSNFPDKVIKAIMSGEMRGLPMTAFAIKQMLSPKAWAEYNKVKQPAWAEYNKVKQQAFWDLFLANEKNRNPKWR